MRCGAIGVITMFPRKSYRELVLYDTFEERFEYLKLRGRIGEDTFGWDRWMNQDFYRSREWRNIRDEIIFRDNGCDLGIEGHEIGFGFYIHHINPITSDDLIHSSDSLLDPDNLILVSRNTHDAIHYRTPLVGVMNIERRANDTCPWRK